MGYSSDEMRQTGDGIQFRSRNCPQCCGTGPIDQGGTRHGGSAAWISRTSAIVGRISRTLVSCSSLSELYLPGESVNCQIQGESVGWWSNIILSPRKTGGFSEGLGTSRRRRVNQGPDTSSRPLTGTGARRVTSLPSDRGSTHHVVAVYQGTMPSLRLSVGRFLPSPIQSVVPFPSMRFFFLFDSPSSSLRTL